MPLILVDESIKLNFAQSLVISHINDIHKLEKVGLASDNNPINKQISLEKFGLFESTAPNFLTYYPDVTASDLIPVEGDFVNPIFRALSQVVVNKRFNPVDFSKNGVLKASIDKLIGQTIFANHEAIVGNEVGVVPDAIWQNSYITDSGITVPAGINAVFKIDGKSHPQISRKLTMEPPAIHSCSVTVQFAWEQSHPSMDMQEFLNKVGTYGSDKQLIRKIVADIKLYHEISLVPHGADAYAQILDKNGKIVNPGYAEGIVNLSADNQEKVRKLFVFSYKEDMVSLSAEDTILKEPIITKDNNPTENLMNKSFLTALALIYGLTAIMDANGEIASFNKGTETLDIKAFEALIKKTKEDADTVATLKGEITTLTSTAATEKTRTDAIDQELTALKANNPAKANEALTALVSDVTANYRKVKGDKADNDFITSLASMDVKTLKSLNTDYTEKLEEQYPMTCSDCGSHEVTRNTAVAGEDDEKPTGKKHEKKTTAQVIAALGATNVNANIMHGNTDIVK